MAREQITKQRTAELEDEAWRNEHFAHLHAVREVPKRLNFSLRTSWDRDDWIREMAKPGSEGGMELDWDADHENYVRQCNELASEEFETT